ncbi:MAG TPA: type 1 glutamine amidotransferase [Gaiellaceae bacterium]|nr:type 1 glutamine amidotransferase [Gaiellaceae bacterium]
MRVLAVTHGPSVGPGVFADAVVAAGHELVEWQVPLRGVPRQGADAVIVLGGAMHPDEEETHGWLGPELRYLEGELERGTPLFGVCLGSQLLARAAGASVFRASEPEVGWLPVERTPAGATDPVASTLPERFDAFQWHQYTHELPDGAVELARSRVCLQAFRLGSAWGVQFHPEVRPEQVDAWLAEDPGDVEDADSLRAETRGRIEAWNDLGRRLCAAFLAAA